MTLGYNSARTTGDLDGVFEPQTKVYELAQIVADESDFGIGKDWLNDGVKRFLHGNDDHAVGVLKDLIGISISVASPRYLFTLKALAGRETDEEDLHVLYPLCEFNSVKEALDSVERSYPLVPLRPNVEYLIRSIAEEA